MKVEQRAPGLSRRFWALIAFFGLSPIFLAMGALALAPLQAFCGIAAVPPRRDWANAAASERSLQLAVAFVLVSAVSAFWAINRDTQQWLRLVSGVALGLCFVAAAVMITEQERLLVRRASVAATIVLQIFLLVIVINTQFLVSKLAGTTPEERVIANPGRGVSYLLFVLWPMVVMLFGWGRAGIATALAALACGAWLSFQFDLTANTIAFALGLAVFGLGLLAPRLVVAGIAFISAAEVLIAPWIAARLPAADTMPTTMPWSWAVRLDIWRFTAERALERPLFGWGIDASRSITRVEHLRGVAFPVPGQHPHNAPLQIWLETGALGAGLAAAALATAGWTLGRELDDKRGPAAALAASWTSFWIVANFGHGLWQEWFVTAPFTIAVLIILLLNKESEGRGAS